jgi:chemotaxis protein CheC
LAGAEARPQREAVTTDYSEIQLDAMRELANIGSGSAATALSTMLGRPLDVSIPNALALPLTDAVDSVGPVDACVVAVAIPVEGDFDAVVLMLLSPLDVETLCGLLGVEANSELGRSAISEVANIFGSSYLVALETMTGLVGEPGPPETAHDILGAIVSSLLVTTVQATDIVLLLGSDLAVEGEECSFSFMLLPDAGCIDEFLAKLGVG